MIVDDMQWGSTWVRYWITTEGDAPPPSEDEAVAFAEEREGQTSQHADPYTWGWVVQFERVYD